MSFNLYEYKNKRLATPLSNGVTTFDLPNGQGPGMGNGVQLTNPDGQIINNSSNDQKIKDIIGDILYIDSTNGDPNEIKKSAQELANVDIPAEFSGKDDLVRLISAIVRRSNEDPEKPSMNLETGEQEKNLGDLATEVAHLADWDVETLIQEAENRRGEENMSGPNKNGRKPEVRTSKKRTPVETTRDEEFKEEEKENPAKKRKKGNPFKVLMGLVGKMLDHGMARREIVRKVLRQEKNKWKPETVEKCIKVVMDARKKEKRNKKASASFNLYKYAASKKADRSKSRKSIYDIKRDVNLMSSMELISRFAYLAGAAGFSSGLYNENNPSGNDLNSRTINEDLKTIKSELKRRNYSDEYIKTLMKTVQGIQE